MSGETAPIPELNDLDRLWDPTNPKAAEASYRSLLAAAESVSGGDRGVLIELCSLIARAEAAQGRLQEAHASLKKAEALLESGDPQASARVSAKVRWLLETGRLHILEKTPSQARPLFVLAWNLAVDSGENYLAVDIALMMAEIEPQKLQQEWLARGIQVAERATEGHAKRWLGSLYMSLGWRRYNLRQYETALEVFQKALSHLKSHGTEREVFVAKWSIGKLLRTMGRTEEALEVQNALLGELKVSHSKDGRLFEELAECLHALKRSAEAQSYFELAYRELSSDVWVVDNQPVALKRLKDLGKVK